MKPEVKKPVSTIHIDGRELTLVQRKLFNLLLWNYYRENDTKKDFYQVKMSSLTKYLGYKSRKDKQLLKSLKKLGGVQIEWNLLDNGKQRWGFCNLISQVEIYDGVLNYSFPSRLKELIDDQRIYSFLKLHVTSLFHSKYSLSLYENMYRFIGVATTGWLDLEIFKTLIGVKNTKLYKDFFELRRKIIEPSIKEINEVSDITIRPDYKRKGRKVIGIKFSVKKKEKPIISQLVELPNIENDKALQEDRDKQAQVQEIISGMPQNDVDKLKNDFLDSIQANKILMKKFKKDGFNSPAIQMSFDSYCQKMLL